MPNKRNSPRAAALDYATTTLLDAISVRSRKSVAGLLKADLVVLEAMRADLKTINTEGRVSLLPLQNTLATLDQAIAIRRVALERINALGTPVAQSGGSGKRAK